MKRDGRVFHEKTKANKQKGGRVKKENKRRGRKDPVRKLTTLIDEEVQGFSRSEPGADIKQKEQMH